MLLNIFHSIDARIFLKTYSKRFNFCVAMNDDYFHFLCQVRVRYSELLIEFGMHLMDISLFDDPEEYLDLLLPPRDEILKILNQAWKKKEIKRKKCIRTLL